MAPRIPDASADRDLRILLGTLDPKAREHLRDVLMIRDQADRAAICKLYGVGRRRSSKGDERACVTTSRS